MSRNVREFDCTPDAVFDVLGDGWLYPSWVVGATRMRAVDARWPHAQSRLHHSIGVWPAVIDDETVSLEWDPPYRAVLQAKGWPIGEARVVIEVKRRGDGCVVRVQEEPVEGPGAAVSAIIQPLLHARNAETLRRLSFLAERRQQNSERHVATGTDRTAGR